MRTLGLDCAIIASNPYIWRGADMSFVKNFSQQISLFGALILKDFNGLTDDELEESCEFDFRYQYALHTTSFEEQPVSKRTLSRFRSRLAAYELTTGEDLLHKCFTELSEGMRIFMEISSEIKRMLSRRTMVFMSAFMALFRALEICIYRFRHPVLYLPPDGNNGGISFGCCRDFQLL